MALLKFPSLRGKRGHGDVRDLVSCKSWLAGLGRLGSPECVAAIADYLREGQNPNLPLLSRLQILDPLRAAVHVALRENADMDEFRSLPLPSAEASGIWELIDTAAMLREAYRKLLPELADLGAIADDQNPQLTALHRAIDVHGQMITLCLVLRIALPVSAWELLCRLGQTVREMDAHDIELPDPFRAAVSLTCREAFVAPVYMALTDPAVLTRIEFQIVRAFARKYAGRVGYRVDAIASAAPRAAARPVANPGPVVRFGTYQLRFDTQRLFASLEKRIDALDQGATPQQINFGERISAPASRALLARMMKMWGSVEVDNIDAPEYHWAVPEHAETLAQVGTPGPRDLGNKLKVAMPTAGVYHYRKERRDGLTRTRESMQKERESDLLEGAEQWRIAGESRDQLVCVRKTGHPRISVNQLAALKPGGKHSRAPLLLGYINGLQQSVNEDKDGRIRPNIEHAVRLKLLTGAPARVNAACEGVEFERVFLLIEGATEEVSAVAVAETLHGVRANPGACTLVLPLAGFRPQREVRVAAGGTMLKLICEELLWRGLDFDLVRFSVSI